MVQTCGLDPKREPTTLAKGRRGGGLGSGRSFDMQPTAPTARNASLKIRPVMLTWVLPSDPYVILSALIAGYNEVENLSLCCCSLATKSVLAPKLRQTPMGALEGSNPSFLKDGANTLCTIIMLGADPMRLQGSAPTSSTSM